MTARGNTDAAQQPAAGDQPDSAPGRRLRRDVRSPRPKRGLAGTGVILAFGVGAGIALSVWVADAPETAPETVAVQGDVGPEAGGEPVTDVTQAGGSTGGVRYVTRGGSSGGAASGGESGGGPTDQATGSEEQAIANPQEYKCESGENGGSTDTGVTGNQIKVAANVVLDGAGASFLREARIGIQAVLDEANVKGICGRKIVLTTRNDSWDAPTGLQYIQNYIDDGAFALVVNPSSEGLNLATQNGTIDNAGIPVVGSDGMLISQYRWPADSSNPEKARWVWPVAASTVSTMHVIVQHAAERGAKTFGLVYDNRYKFGQEGAEAFEGAYNRLKDQHGLTKLYTLPLDDPDLPTYTGQVAKFNEAGNCGSDADRKCDLVAMLLTPSTAITWIKSGGTFGKLLTSGPQPLFNRDFAVNCVQERQKLGRTCDLVVWTGYNPPVGALASKPDVAKYVSDVKSRNAQADVENSFTEGAYLGARVFVKALELVGPNVTRENLKAVLDGMTYTSDLTNELAWTSTSHFANTRMQAFRVGYTPNGFAGWQDENTGWIQDRWIGQY